MERVFFFKEMSWNFEIGQGKMIFWQKSGNFMMKGHWSYSYFHLVTKGLGFFHFVLLLSLIYTHILIVQHVQRFSCFQETCKTMLQGCVLVTGAQLRAKYSELENLTNEQKIAEYALTIIK